MKIKIDIENKRASIIGAPVIVCGNSDYTIKFTFDSEWDVLTAKTVRFVYLQGAEVRYTDVVISGDTANVPVFEDIREVLVGVFQGELRTTTPARIPCESSIRCGSGAPADPTPSQYDQIIALLAQGVTDADIAAAVEAYLRQNPATAPVSSVNGQTGDVKLTAEDIGALPASELQTAVDSALSQAKESGEFDGKKGDDGISPTVAVNEITGGYRLTITDKDGTKNVDVMDGGKGDSGRGIKTITRTSGDGTAGTTDTYTITYTDNTTSAFAVYNGKDGTNGTTPVKGTDYWTAADKSAMVSDVLAALPTWNGGSY